MERNGFNKLQMLSKGLKHMIQIKRMLGKWWIRQQHGKFPYRKLNEDVHVRYPLVEYVYP
jgi:hypothetical protein